MVVVIGWDIGGAHLKAARAENGRVVAAVQVASPLRFGLARLGEAFAEAKARIGSADRHLITMTGELADTFSSRTEGVEQLTAAALRELAPCPVLLYAGRAGFVDPAAALRHVEEVASANWHVSASLVARHCPAALFVDMGSTTTDLIPVLGGGAAARGYTDAERLSSGELVYTGLVRSFVMGLAQRAPFAGTWAALVHENFATAADVHRILGALPEHVDQMSTADGRGKTVEASCARLARMVGRDASDATAQAWRGLAQWFAEAQLRTVTDAAMLVLSDLRLPADAPIVGAGIGEPVIAEVARRLRRRYLPYGDLLDIASDAREAGSHCAPAAALAILGSHPEARPPVPSRTGFLPA